MELSMFDNSIIVTEYAYRLKLLKEMNNNSSFISIKFMTKKEFLDNYYFSYDEKAIYYLMDKYGIDYGTSKIYLDNLVYIEDKNYTNDKLIKLFNIKKELIANDLLIFNPLFLDYIKDKKIYFYKYNFLSKLEHNMISKLSNVTIIEKEKGNYSHDVYEFDTIFSEVEFVANSILKLIDEGINPSLIKLSNVTDDYINVIKFIFSLYGIKISLNDNFLISNPIVKEFLDIKGPINDKISSLVKKYKNNNITNQIVKIVNKYVIFDNVDIVNKMIFDEFKHSKIETDSFDNEIEIIDFKNYPITDEYVFLLGFNQNSVPIIHKDEDYITDSLKEELLLDDTNTKNKMERETVIANILSIKNLVITYKLSSPFGTFYPSNLISDMNLSVIKDFKYEDIYSLDYAKLMLGLEYDKYILYNTVSDRLKSYHSTIEIPYNTYDNSFKGINNKNFLEYIKSGFNLSYSSMNDYYNCSFKYYLSHVLKINIFEDNFNTYIGSLFHYCLEKGLNSLEDTSSLVAEFTASNERVLTKKEEFFVKNLIPEIDFARNTILDNMNNTDLKKTLFEKEVKVLKKGKVSVTFKGFIDKIMYDNVDDKTIVAIIDYKTGNTDVNLKYLPFGLSMQLPVYLYLANNMEEFSNVKIGGFYIQKVLFSKPVIDSKKDYLLLKRDNLLLNGYSNSDKDILKCVDNTYVDSKIIKSMKLKKDGEFYSYAKVLNDNEIDAIVKITDLKINEAIDSICNGVFDINPKVINDKNLGCLYCEYRDICFKEKKDEVVITPKEDLSFLGGDLNA